MKYQVRNFELHNIITICIKKNNNHIFHPACHLSYSYALFLLIIFTLEPPTNAEVESSSLAYAGYLSSHMQGLVTTGSWSWVPPRALHGLPHHKAGCRHIN